MDLARALSLLQGFSGTDLTRTLANVEATLYGATADKCIDALASCGAQADVLAAAGLMKRMAGQINTVIHALGILVALPHILQRGEIVQYVSLGAGNTGRAFDLETNMRIAEFKFIWWQGGSETIRQNALFKDFFLLAEHATSKQKFLYVLGTKYPLKFLNSKRSLASVVSRRPDLKEHLEGKFGKLYSTVAEYYAAHRSAVVIQDISLWVAGLVAAGIEESE